MTSSISTSYMSSSLQLSLLRMQSELTTAQTETTTGQYADLGLQLGAQAGEEISLQNEYGLLTTLTNTNSSVTTRLNATTSAIDAMRTDAQNALNSLTEWTPGTNAGATLASLGQNSLRSLISSLNTSVAGQYIFGGINNGAAPISDYFAAPNTAQANIQTAFSTYLTSIGATASTITATQMQTFLSSPSFTSQFQSPGWSAPGSNWSQASSTNVSSNISPNETIDTSTNANKPEFGQLAQAYVMLNEFTGSGVNADAYQVVVTAATGLVSDALTSMTATEAQVGAVTQQVAEATSNMSAQMGVLQTQIGNLDNANAYQTATRVSSLTTQIQTAYSLTAQLQQLSLVKYL